MEIFLKIYSIFPKISIFGQISSFEIFRYFFRYIIYFLGIFGQILQVHAPFDPVRIIQQGRVLQWCKNEFHTHPPPARISNKQTKILHPFSSMFYGTHFLRNCS